MTDAGASDTVKGMFTWFRPGFLELATRLVDDAEAAVADAQARYEGMVPDLAYVDNPNAPMARALFWCSAALALFLALESRSVGVHDFGRTMLDWSVPMPDPDSGGPQARKDWLPAFIAAGEVSQREQRKGEFVYEAFGGTDEQSEWGIDIKSCAICHQFSKFGAMDLVPYMCAMDDVFSDRTDAGLRRTGTIALGAHQCDFRYQPGGQPVRLVEQYRDRIKVAAE